MNCSIVLLLEKLSHIHAKSGIDMDLQILFEELFTIQCVCRMYQALLALGSQKSATNMLSKILKEDPHVCAVIYACQAAYRNCAQVGGKKNKKKKKNAKADLRLETINILSNLEEDHK